MPYERLLIATDLSDHAARSAELARGLVGSSAKVRVAYTAEVPALHDYMAPNLRTQIEESRKKQLVDARAQVADWAKACGLEAAEVAILEGSVGRSVADDARAWRADLLALGARGHSRVVGVLLGSKAASIIRHAPCDTLVGRENSGQVKRILLATDFFEPAKLAAARALDLSKRTGAELVVLHVHDDNVWNVGTELPAATSGSREWLNATLRDMMHEFNTEVIGGVGREIVEWGRPATVASKVAKREKADLTVVGTHGAGLIERALLGSTASEIASKAPCSVLVVHGPE